MPQATQPIPAVLDASFWINAARSGRLRYLPEYFLLAAPPRVAAELTALLAHPQPPAASVAFAAWRQQGLVQIAGPHEPLRQFDAGENEAIALAQERGWALLIDNSQPREWSRGPFGLRVIDSPAFAVFLYDQGRLDCRQATAALAQSQAARRVVREALLLLAELARWKGEADHER